MHIQNQAVSILSLLSWESISLHIEEQNRRSKGTMQCPWPKSCQAQCILLWECNQLTKHIPYTGICIPLCMHRPADEIPMMGSPSIGSCWRNPVRGLKSRVMRRNTPSVKRLVLSDFSVYLHVNTYMNTHTHSHLWYKHVLKYCMYIYMIYIYAHAYISYECSVI